VTGDSLENIVIKTVKSAPRNDLISLYKEAGWWEASPEDNLDFLNHLVNDSAVFVGVFLDEKMIGMGRALSDLVSDAYIQDVTVLKKFRGRGTGKKIIGKLVYELKRKGVDWIGLIAEPGTSSFYKELGFQVLEKHIPFKYEGLKNV
jgi:ribosomal protein S18 acetylase RimI-like enzyme